MVRQRSNPVGQLGAKLDYDYNDDMRGNVFDFY
jgi:hypothetical protein